MSRTPVTSSNGRKFSSKAAATRANHDIHMEHKGETMIIKKVPEAR